MIIPDDSKANEVELQLKTWLYSAVEIAESETHPENFRYQETKQTMLSMIRVMDAQIWGRDLIEQLEFPATWTDAFKLRFFPEWLLEKYPATVKYINLRELFPQVSKNPGVVNGNTFLKSKNSVALLPGSYTVPPL